tara:strand:+ start:56 stop:1102 length:1047 start_codon:yes stop_codon:yes gene_type:complete
MGLLDNIGNKLSSMSDDDRRGMALGLASGFAGMSGNPNAGNIMQGIGRQQDALAKRRDAEAAQTAAAKQSSDGMAALRDAGIDEKMLAIAKSNPALMQTIAKAYADSKINPNRDFALQVSPLQTDQATGQQYVVTTNTNTGVSTRTDVTGASGLTGKQKLEQGVSADKQKIANQSTQTLKDQDTQNARDAGMIAFNDMTSVAKTIVSLTQAKKAVKEDGASVGFAQNWLPAFDAATAELRQIANKMGIEVINSATFGALSETELKLALTTAFPTDLNEAQLLVWIDNKINAQNKMYKALSAKAKKLTSGITMTEFITLNTTDEADIDSRFNQTSSMSALDAAILKKGG